MVLYVSNTAPRSARRHLFVPIPKGSTWMPVRPKGRVAWRVSRSAGIALPLTRRKRRWRDDAGVSRLRHSGYGRIIFYGHVLIRTTPRIMKIAPNKAD